MDPAAFVSPMLATTAARPFSDHEWRFEVKWDGWRAIVSLTDDLRVWSRRGHPLLGRYPVLVQLSEEIVGPAVLDGELVAWENGQPSFHALARAGSDAVFIAFDCLYDRSGWHLHEPLRERLARLEACTRPVRRLVRADGVLGQGEAFYEAARERGLEGVMAKRLDSRYTPGRRTTAWQKFLIYKTEVFWAVGWVRHPDQLSVLLAEDRGPLSRHYVGRVAVPSLPGGERPPEDVMEARFERPWRIWVQYRERTPDGHLRHPVFRAFEAEP